MSKDDYFIRILILGLLTTLSPFSIDMYLPGFTAIAQDLHTDTNTVTLSLTSFFIGLAAGQLLYGPLLDRFGRKNPLYVGMAIYIAASLGCLWVHTVNALIILRLVQAIGSCAAGVASIAMVRDLFPVEDNAKVFSLLMLILGASPMVAPTVGGYVTAQFGWHMVFVILAVIAILTLLAVIFILPESYQPDTSVSLKPLPIIRNFWLVITEPQFFTYVFAGSFAFTGLFAYVAASPVIFMSLFGLSGQTYGWIFAGLSVGFIGSAQVNNIVMRYYKSEQIILFVVIIQVIAGMLFIIGAMYGWLGLPGTILFIFANLCCLGFISPNSSALAMAPFSQNAGSASALMGFLQLSVGALATYGVGAFKSHTVIALAGIMASSSIIALLILFIGRSRIPNKIEVSANAGIMVH